MMGRDSMGFCDCLAGPDCRGECERWDMVACRHQWSLRDVRSPFSGLATCRSCGAAVRMVFEQGATRSSLHLSVLDYGLVGLSLDDLEAVLVWLGRQLQLGEVKEALATRPVRHKKRRKVAWGV